MPTVPRPSAAPLRTSPAKALAGLLVFLLLMVPVLAESDPGLPTDGTEPTGSFPTEPGSETEPDDRVPLPAEGARGMVSAGLLHSLVLTENGALLSFGSNEYGQLGDGTFENRDEPTTIPGMDTLIQVSAGAYHSLVLDESGDVFAFGRNVFGQLGDGTTLNRNVPVLVEGLPPIQKVSAGAFHSLAMTIDGALYAWGMNSNLQVGDVQSETVVDSTGKELGKRVVQPVLVVESGVTDIAAGGMHSLYLTVRGEVFAFGSNEHGQLGDGTTLSRGRPVKVPGLPLIRSIAAGYEHSLVLSDRTAEQPGGWIRYQTLFAFGSNSQGQCGVGSVPGGDAVPRDVTRPERIDLTGDAETTNDRARLVSAGSGQTLVTVPVPPESPGEPVRERILVFGSNSHGQLAIARPIGTNRPESIQVTVDGWTGTDFLPFVSVSTGGYHTLFLSVKGFLGAVGRNDAGQLGNRSTADVGFPVGIVLPDLLAPAWPSDSRAASLKGSDGVLLLSWPAARDNLGVAGYRVSYRDREGRVVTRNSRGKLEIVLTRIDFDTPQWILVQAYDAAGNQADVPLLYAFLPEGVTVEEAFPEGPDSDLLPLPVVPTEEPEPEPTGELSPEPTNGESPEPTEDASGEEPTPDADLSPVPSEALSPAPGTATPVPATPSPQPATATPVPEIAAPLLPWQIRWNPDEYGIVRALETPWSLLPVYGEGVVPLPVQQDPVLFRRLAIVAGIAAVVLLLWIGTAVALNRRRRPLRGHQGTGMDMLANRLRTRFRIRRNRRRFASLQPDVDLPKPNQKPPRTPGARKSRTDGKRPSDAGEEPGTDPDA